ncbi:hypothetical protein CLV30_12584 [Haloactinopolyspora alba]|uniref:Uncharacterized protein n=1 Tax=Haloactinopolyspora alba TaxID=648780 RepID=A0A2P8DHK6_9ACTN|nr:hypothetical protein [Haloactinopolyspora alba]PSK96702.1 hypothetical protein CLV30_12584 [Haloactinopolyspora alba]
MTTTEAEWDDDQRSLMLALAEYRDGACPCGCGGRAAETLDPANEDRYTSDPPTRCHRRTALLRAQEQLATDRQNRAPQAGALLFRADLRTDTT